MHFTAIRNRVTDNYTNLPSKSSSATVTGDFCPVAFVDTMQLPKTVWRGVDFARKCARFPARPSSQGRPGI
ncbi:hypothetical protein quinque_004445 [Culex quinquefasciatus]